MKNFIECKVNPRKDLFNKRFGKLTALRAIGLQNKKIVWECLCECNKMHLVNQSHLVSGSVLSCGCLQKESKNIKHGMYGTSTYKTWAGMLQRCYNKKETFYKDYGGRGIEVNKKWKDFKNFYKDMGQRPKGLELDRIDNNKGYSKENCRWTTKKINCRNRRSSIILKYNGKEQCISDWADEIGLSMNRISQRLRRGWSIEKTLTEPLDIKKINKKYIE